MKTLILLKQILFVLLSMISISTIVGQQNVSEMSDIVYKGDYLGLDPPTEKPKAFAPEVFQQKNYYPHGTIAFSPDGDEIFWGVIVRGEKTSFEIMTIKQENGIWSKPEKAKFLGEYWGLCPIFSGDGTRLYYHSNKPQEGVTSNVGSTLIYYSEKVNGEWTDPKYCSINTGNELSLTQSANGTIYYASIANSLKGLMDFDIYKCRLENNQVVQVERLCDLINSGFQDFFPYISPDERLLLFSSDRSGVGDPYKQRLYASFKKRDNNWGEAIDLSNALGLLDGQDAFPSITPDGKYLFFHSTRNNKEGGYYWVNLKKLLKELDIKHKR